MKKFLILPLTAMLLMLLPITSYAAEEGSCGPNLNYTFSDTGILFIYGTGPMYNYVSYNSSGSHAPWVKYRESIKSVAIGYGATTIGDFCFADCINLAEVSLSETVTSINKQAFKGCSSLENLTIPNSVTILKNLAFRNCKKLKSITIPGTVKTIEPSAFSGCEGLERVEIGDGVETIGDSAFNECTNLSELTLGNGILTIGNRAFYECTSLTNITIPDSVTSIGSHAFTYCSNLISLTIGKGVTDISHHAFSSCTALTEINWNAVSVADLSSESNVFSGGGHGGEGIKIVFGDSVEKIPARAFNTYYPKNIPKIIDISIGENVKSIGDEAFYEADITSLIIPDSVESIGDYAFAYCMSIESIILGNSIKSIGARAFNNCSKPKSIIIPDSVVSIGDAAFEYCSRLESVKIPDSVTNIGDYAFYSCSGMKSLTIGKEVKTIGQYAFAYCTELTEINWSAKSVDDFSSYNYVFYMAGGGGSTGSDIISRTARISIVPDYSSDGAGIKVVFGDSVEKIPAYAFCPEGTYSYVNIISATIPQNVLRIGVNAFKRTDDLVIYGITGSAAETYAIENNIPFIPIEQAAILQIDIDKTSNQVVCNVKLNNSEKGGKIIGTMYTEQGDLVDTALYDAEDNVIVAFEDGLTGSYVKIMWWNSLDNIKPMCKSKTVSL